MDDVTLQLVARRFQSFCKDLSVTGVTIDPDRENGLIYQTMAGKVYGKVWEEGDNFVFRVGRQEVVVPKGEFWGKSRE